MTDESTADDGAIYEFWAFIEAVRARRHPPGYAFDLDRVDRFLDAVADYEANR